MPCFENAESSPAEFGKLTSCCEELIIRRETDFFTWSPSNRTRGNGFKLKEGRFRLDATNKFFYSESGEAWEQVAQRSCGCPISGGI